MTFLLINIFLNKIIKAKRKKLDLLDVGAGKGSLKKYISKNLIILAQIFIKKNLKQLLMMILQSTMSIWLIDLIL